MSEQPVSVGMVLLLPHESIRQIPYLCISGDKELCFLAGLFPDITVTDSTVVLRQGLSKCLASHFEKSCGKASFT